MNNCSHSPMCEDDRCACAEWEKSKVFELDRRVFTIRSKDINKPYYMILKKIFDEDPEFEKAYLAEISASDNNLRGIKADSISYDELKK